MEYVAFVSIAQTLTRKKGLRAFSGSPILAVEVTSPSNTHQEIVSKMQAYLLAGSSRVCVVDPESRTVTVYQPDWTARVLNPGDTLTSDDAGFEVEGFALTIDEVFEDA